jgi:hypothetical protein
MTFEAAKAVVKDFLNPDGSINFKKYVEKVRSEEFLDEPFEKALHLYTRQRMLDSKADYDLHHPPKHELEIPR